MNTKVKVVRALWGDDGKTMKEVPVIPTIENQIVYVWGSANNDELIKRGYHTILMDEVGFDEPRKQYGRKLIALDLALQEFGEVMMLDWDCHILRPLEDKFYEYLLSKEIQCPLYAQHKHTSKALQEIFMGIGNYNELLAVYTKSMEIEFTKYSWTVGDALATPNFSFVYSRNKELGSDLIKIAKDNDLIGCIEEHAMWIYSNCSVSEYIERYQPCFVQGVSDDRTDHEFIISKAQRALNSFVSSRIKMDLYLKVILKTFFLIDNL
jgi:hypothetical protein